MNDHKKHNFIPALKYHMLTRFYDTVVRLTTREMVFKTKLVNQVVSKPGECLLDLGCGTGTLTKMIAESDPELHVVGFDADPATLKQAQKKLSSLGGRVTLQQGFAQQIPFSADSFDIVVSSLFFHHLTREQKIEVLNEMFRVLKPDGRLHIAD
jgi:ubiquinone/menaquinone biosynthesis C-methylase UbiE